MPLVVFRIAATAAELQQPAYLNLELPFSVTALSYINPILIGGAELYRNSQTDPEKRCYPGGFFDPLKLASEDPERAFSLKTAEIKHARLAMVAFFGEFCKQRSGVGHWHPAFAGLSSDAGAAAAACLGSTHIKAELAGLQCPTTGASRLLWLITRTDAHPPRSLLSFLQATASSTPPPARVLWAP